MPISPNEKSLLHHSPLRSPIVASLSFRQNRPQASISDPTGPGLQNGAPRTDADQDLSLVTERISPTLIRISPCSVFREKFPESSFCVMLPSVGLGNSPVSGRSVT